MIFTKSGEADGGAFWPIRICVVDTSVAAFILDGDRLDGELAVRQRGAQPDSPLVWGLYHGVTSLGERGHFLRVVSPHDLLDLFRQPIGTREGRLLSPHRCLVAVGCDLCWRKKRGHNSGRA